MNEQETPSERFVRLANKRVNAVLERLDILGNCSNRQYYEYSEEDLNAIFKAIEKKVKDIRARFYTKVNNRFEL